MNKFINNPTGSDVSFYFSDGRIIHAHRVILASQSPIFYKSFYGKYSDSTTKQFAIEEFSYSTFLSMVSQLYEPNNALTYSVTTKFLNSGQESISDENLTKIQDQIERLSELFQIAEFYQVGFLKEKCIDLMLNRSLDLRCVKLLLGSENEFVKQCCFKFLCREFEDGEVRYLIVNELDQKQFAEIISSDDLQASEYQVLLVINDWCSKRLVDLEPLLTCIRANNLLEVEKRVILETTGKHWTLFDQRSGPRNVFEYHGEKKRCEVSCCAICRNCLLHNCIECESKNKLSMGGCKRVSGYCGHIFHEHCVARWQKVRDCCPLCAGQWSPVIIESRTIAPSNLPKNKN
jgi:RING-box protein 1